MKINVKRKALSFFLCVALIGNIFPVNSVAAEKDLYALTYHVGAYDMFPESDGSISVMIDGKKYYYSDDFDDEEIATKISGMENQNVVYELHDSKIVKVYTMDEVLSQEVTVEPSVKDGLTYRKGKFSQKSFELVVKVSNNLQGDFKKNDLLWFLSESEKNCLYSTLKKLEIKPSNEVDFGSSGWWMWKEYEKTISENMNDVIRAEETKEYKYTVNLHNDGVVNRPKYDINIYATPTFDTGVGRRAEGKIQVGNLDYQEEKTEEKKATSNAGKSVAQAATTLDGIQNAIQFSNDLFSADQIDQINEFVNIWMSELLLAKCVDKSDLREYLSKEAIDKLFKKLGIDTGILTIPGKIQATTYLETKTQDSTKVLIQVNINLTSFDVGDTGMPTMATGSGEIIVYSMDGEKLDSSVILPAYANVCAFCEQLQDVAKNTIFNGAKEYLGIFGKSAEATAEALSSKMMEKILNNNHTKNVFKRINAKDVKAVLKKIIIEGEQEINDKIFELVTTPSKESTEISIKCPVDVKIYDNDGNLCGVVKDNVVDSTYDDIFVNVVGDQKNIYLVGDDYSFEMTGTDDGSMDYVVREFDDEGNTTREITYEKIELSDGCKYYSYVPEAVNHSNTLFDLTDNKGNVILPTKGADTDSIIGNTGGKCGENVYWELSENGTLHIYGNGKMQTGGFHEPWRKYKEQITSVVIEDGVTSIREFAFATHTCLENVVIGNGITEIEFGAFDRCTSLSSIIIPDSVSSMGGSVFEDCTNLSSVTIGKGVKSIGDDAFRSCKNLTKTNYLGTVDQWAGIEFSGSTANPLCWASGELYINDKLITNIQLTNVEKISNYAFCGCSNFTSLTIGNGVTDIGTYAFGECTNLKDVTIGNEVTEIEMRAFEKCISLSNITIGNGVKSIGFLAFNGCENLSKTNYIGTIDQWAEIFFPLHFTEYYAPTSNPIFYSKNLYINDVLATDIELDRAKKISDYAFYGCLSLTSVTISSSMADIGYKAFCGCNSLTSLTILERVTSIGERAFWGCSCLTSVTSLSSLNDIGIHAFEKCDSLNSVMISEGTTSIGESAFYGCKKLISIVIPEGITNIGNHAFYDCNSLNSVLISKGATSIGDYAFYGCGKLNSIIIPEGVTSIGESAFYNCYSLTSVTISEGMINIGEHAFCYCSNLTNMIIPEGVTSIGSYAFSGCNSLTSITIPKDVTRIEKGVFANCDGLISVTIPEGVTNIDGYAFSGCISLSRIIIPEGVTSIGVSAFYCCNSLTSVAIPVSVTDIGFGVFDQRWNILNIYYAGSETQWNEIVKETNIGLSTYGAIHYNSSGIPLPSGNPTNVPETTKKPIETSKPPEMTKNPVRTTRPLETGHPSGTNRPSETGSYPSVIGNPESDKNTILTDTHTKSVYKVMGNGTVQYIKPIVAVSEISIPAVVTIDNTTYKVTSIVANAFKNNKQITKVVIGKNIKTIEKSAFSGCTKLKTVAMGNNVTTIANKAFYKCSALKKITIPASVTVIGKKAFYGCKKLKFIAIKTKKIKSKSVGEQSFKGIHKKAIIKVPKRKKKVYQKWLKKKGITKKMRIK